jgi:hypothetical protein
MRRHTLLNYYYFYCKEFKLHTLEWQDVRHAWQTGNVCVVLVGRLKLEHILVEGNFNINRNFLGRIREVVDEVVKV